MPLIDRHLPATSADFAERHERAVEVTAERALEIGLAAPAAPDPIVGALMRLRGVPRADSIAELLVAIGLEPQERTPTEAVFAGRIRPHIRVAADLRAESLSDGRSRVITETRVAADDARSRRRFRLYWFAIRPFSGLIRRRWLAAIARRSG
ncbi:MAG: hypothetical protein ACRDL1_09830 [Solirubrobacterales bacterium]